MLATHPSPASSIPKLVSEAPCPKFSSIGLVESFDLFELYQLTICAAESQFPSGSSTRSHPLIMGLYGGLPISATPKTTGMLLPEYAPAASSSPTNMFMPIALYSAMSGVSVSHTPMGK